MSKPKKLTKQQVEEQEASRKVKIREIEIPVGDEDDLSIDIQGEVARFWIIPPSRHVVNLIAKHAQNKDLDKANKAVIQNCVLAGDFEYIEETSDKCDDAIYMALLEAVGQLIGKKKAAIKKR